MKLNFCKISSLSIFLLVFVISNACSNTVPKKPTVKRAGSGNFISISNANNVTLAIGSNGELYGAGERINGLLADNFVPIIYTPKNVPNSFFNGNTVAKVSSKSAHTVILTISGSVYTTGSDDYAQIGNSERSSKVFIPYRVIFPSGTGTIIDIAAGSNHSVALDSNGKMYAWGFNIYGQVGNDSATVRIEEPTAVNQGDIPTGVKITKISAGNDFTLALGDNGKLYSWGSQRYGKLGDDVATDNNTFFMKKPVAVNNQNIGSNKITDISAGYDHAVVIDVDGTIYAWGTNKYSQAGGDRYNNNGVFKVPTKLKTSELGDIKFSKIAAGGDVTVALGKDDKLYIWGSNYFGQTAQGDDNIGNILSTPKVIKLGAIPPSARIVAMGVGSESVYVACDNKKIYTWGAQLVISDDGSTPLSNPLPVEQNLGEISINSAIKSLVVGNGNIFAILDNNSLFSWGQAPYGVLANPNYIANNVLKYVETASHLNGAKISKISSGVSHILALTKGGELYGWGVNSVGELGLNEADNEQKFSTHYTPKKVTKGDIPENVKITDVAANGYTTSVALGSDGKIYSWGKNAFLSLGVGSDNTDLINRTPRAVVIPANKKFKQVASGYGHTVALTTDGEIYSWGYNGAGGLGDGTKISSNKAIKVSAGDIPASAKILQVGAGRAHSLALDDNGEVYAWGQAIGTTYPTDQTVPKRVDLTNVIRDNNVTITAIGSGYVRASFVIASNGKVYAWGDNSNGQLGNNSYDNKTTPIEVGKGISHDIPDNVSIVQVYPGDDHTVLLGDNGKIYTFGRNNFGQLGNVTFKDSPSPTVVDVDEGEDFYR